MNNDESSIDSGNLGLKKQLDLILLQLINTMEQSRGDIFNILKRAASNLYACKQSWKNSGLKPSG